VRIEFQGLVVGLAGFVELAFVLVGNREIVVGGGVVGIDLDGALPAVQRFPPELLLGREDPELDLRLRALARRFVEVLITFSSGCESKANPAARHRQRRYRLNAAGDFWCGRRLPCLSRSPSSHSSEILRRCSSCWACNRWKRSNKSLSVFGR
jgi:hypothetical protein